MKNDRIPAQVLSAVVIPQVDENLRNAYGLAENQTSCAVFTATFDDFIFLALDDATKKANVTASYIHSFYAGGPNASSKLQGEGIGILAGETVAEILAGVDAVLEAERSEMVCAISCNEDDSITSLTCTVARTGTLFEKFFGIPAGSSIAYLAGPPRLRFPERGWACTSHRRRRTAEAQFSLERNRSVRRPQRPMQKESSGLRTIRNVQMKGGAEAWRSVRMC